jgi:hypothetical protein
MKIEGDILGWVELDAMPENEAIVLFDICANAAQKRIDETLANASSAAIDFYQKNKNLLVDEYYKLASNEFKG